MFNGITIEPKSASIAFAFCYHGRESVSMVRICHNENTYSLRGHYNADSVRIVPETPVVVTRN